MNKLTLERVATLGVFLGNGLGIGAWAVAIPLSGTRILDSSAPLSSSAGRSR